MRSGYDIIHTVEYDAELEGVFQSSSKGDECTKGVLGILNRNPYLGYPSEEDVWCYKLGERPIFLAYTINEKLKRVYLLSIKDFSSEPF